MESLAPHPTPQTAQDALRTLHFPDSQEFALGDALTPPVAEAFEAGWAYSRRHSTDPTAALKEGALGAALAQLKIDLKGVSAESVAQIGDALAEAVQAGESATQAAARIEPILHDAKRAMVIARTEIARAMEGALLAGAKATGGMDKEWLDAPGACPICQANTAQGPIPLSRPFRSEDPNPPAHPNCRCALALVPDGTAS